MPASAGSRPDGHVTEVTTIPERSGPPARNRRVHFRQRRFAALRVRSSCSSSGVPILMGVDTISAVL
jgi:hypothetical protein